MSRRNKAKKPTVPYGGVLAVEDLPNPFVFYPWSGPWIEFRPTEDCCGVFCSCFRKALEKYLEINADSNRRHRYGYSFEGRAIRTLLNPNQFSKEFVKSYLINVSDHLNPDVVIRLFKFENSLCHFCNQKIPNYRFCVPMYGGVFRQNYGWYIEKIAYSLGLRKSYFDQSILDFADKNLPNDILEEIAQLDELEKYSEILPSKIKYFRTRLTQSQLEKLIGNTRLRINNWIENQARDAFGYKRIGEGWTSETMLSKLIEEIYPNVEIVRRAKPEFLSGLELDIFIPSLQIGIEYQGIQHFRPVEHWGGRDALTSLQERDKTKRLLCKQNGIRLLYFYYDEDITLESAHEKLSGARRTSYNGGHG